jgi:CubicO group peptidase (beta-lactamase class C family)
MDSKIQKCFDYAAEKDLFSLCEIGMINSKAEVQKFRYLQEGYLDSLNQESFEAPFVFDCASITKTFPTGILALMGIEEQKLELNQPIREILPEFKAKNAEGASLLHLLTHTLDYRISLASLRDETPQSIMKSLFEFEFPRAPGDSYLYCNASSVVLGKVLEQIYQKPLAVVAQEKLFDPMGLKSTSFKPLEFADLKQIVPTEECAWRGRTIRGEVHDESASAMQKDIASPTVGSAGLFTTTDELLVFLHEVMNEESKIITSFIRQAILQKHPLAGLELCLGWECNSPRWMPPMDRQILGKTGFTGQTILWDVEKELGLVILCNSTWPKRPKTVEAINEFRKFCIRTLLEE